MRTVRYPARTTAGPTARCFPIGQEICFGYCSPHRCAVTCMVALRLQNLVRRTVRAGGPVKHLLGPEKENQKVGDNRTTMTRGLTVAASPAEEINRLNLIHNATQPCACLLDLAHKLPRCVSKDQRICPTPEEVIPPQVQRTGSPLFNNSSAFLFAGSFLRQSHSTIEGCWRHCDHTQRDAE